MFKYKFWAHLLTVLNLLVGNNAHTHWVVTENGRIETYVNSPFSIRRPNDLFSLFDQEKRMDDIVALYQDLVTRKNTIDEKLTKVKDISTIGGRLEDYACLRKGKAVTDVDFYADIATNGSKWRGIEFDLDYIQDVDAAIQIPLCSRFMKLENGQIPYDRFYSVRSRINVTISAEPALRKHIKFSSVDTFGHEIALELTKNASSWLHYNLAAIYWRIIGDGPNSIECSRISLFFCPRMYKDIPLHTLAGTVHQGRYSRDAMGLLLIAIPFAPEEVRHLLALGNVHAAMGEYNTSITYYDKYIKIKDDETVQLVKQAVTCFWKVEQDLHKIEGELQDVLKFFKGILKDLHDYHGQQKIWLQLQERMSWEQAGFDKNQPRFGVKHHYMNEIDSFDLQGLFNFVETKTQQISDQLAKGKDKNGRFTNLIKMAVTETQPKGKDGDGKISSKKDATKNDPGRYYFDTVSWPTRENCQEWNLAVDEKEDLNLPVFLKPDTRGYETKKILSTLIKIPEGTDHALPWYPPSCENFEKYDNKISNQFDRQSLALELKTTDYLKKILLGYVNDGRSQEAEIGQRIITAVEKKAAPKWVLATLASLYWRVRGNTKKALSCLDLAVTQVDRHQDSALIYVSVGSIALELGLIDNALKFTTKAFNVDDGEPNTNFLLALLHYRLNKPILAMYYLKNVLRANPKFYNGYAEMLLKTWGCRLKLGTYPDLQNTLRSKLSDKSCLKGASSFNGEGVVCSVNGEHCKTASIQCYKTENGASSGVDVSDDIKSKLNANCVKQKGVISTMITETENDVANTIPHQAFHMRISLGENQASTVSVALTEDPVPEALLQLYDKTGTLLLSPRRCKDIKDAEWVPLNSMWQSIAIRNIEIGSLLKPLTKALKDEMRPYCNRNPPLTSTMDYLLVTLLRSRLPGSPEKGMLEWLGLMAGDQKASLKELGAKIHFAIRENNTSWVLANAAAMYWRIFGNTEEAVICIRQAVTYVPHQMRDIPLMSLANLLNRIGFHGDAIEAAYSALQTHPNYVFNHYTAGNIHSTTGDFEKAISFYRSSLVLDQNFAPARNRLLAISCTLLYDESGELREGDLTEK